MELKSDFRRLNSSFEVDFSLADKETKKSVEKIILNWSDEQNDKFEFKTSGSTGIPKIVSFSADEVAASAQNTIQFFNILPKEKVLLSLPTEFVAGALMCIRAMIAGTQLTILKPSLRPLQSFRQFVSFDFAPFTPAQIAETLSKGSELELEILKNIKTIILGGGVVNDEIVSAVQNFRGAVFQTYGMTETLTHIAVKKINKKRDIYYRLVNDDIQISTDERGCLVLQVPYLTQKEIVTNDLASIIDKKQFEWIGRYDFVINSGGIKIIPELIERELQPLLRSKDFYVSSIADKVLGERCVLVLQQEDWDKKELDDLQYLLESYKNHHYPKQIHLVSRIDKTDTGKIKREKF